MKIDQQFLDLFLCADNYVPVSRLSKYSLSLIRVPSERRNRCSLSDSSVSLAIRKR